MPIPAVIGAVALAGVATAGASVYAANRAATAQKNANSLATTVQANNINNAISQEAPYTGLGSVAAKDLQTALPSLTAPITMSESDVQNTPGYQFDLTQGLKSTGNSFAGRGLAGNGATAAGGIASGPAVKAAQSYATGLADNTYLNQFNMANTNKTNAYNRLLQAAQLGQNATGNVTATETNAANNIAANQQQSGNAGANALMADASAISNAGNSLSNGLVLGSYGNMVNNASNPNNNSMFGGPTISQLFGGSGNNQNNSQPGTTQM